ncbi:hypothetical protein ABID00_002696 [Faecalicatena orotica]
MEKIKGTPCKFRNFLLIKRFLFPLQVIFYIINNRL